MFILADYNASKAALISLHESLRYELDHVYNAPDVRTTLVIAGHILTPLFSSVRHPKSFLYKFFFPSLLPVDVVKAIIAALDEQHSRVLYMPFYAHFVPLVHMFPSYLRHLAQWVRPMSGSSPRRSRILTINGLQVTQCDYSSHGFVKVSGRRPEEGPAPEVQPRDKRD